jgi:NIPSNAP
MFLEIRTYRLRPGTREGFVKVMREEALPLLAKAGIDVVACGPSLVDEDGNEEAFLMRAFPTLEAHASQEEVFYSSDAWRSGPREAIISCIESYHSVVVSVPERAVAALRESAP